jgi:hypothetical protein
MRKVNRHFPLFMALVLSMVLVFPAPSTSAETREVQNKRIALNLFHREMFATRDFAQLDAGLNKVQAEYESGDWSELQLISLFNTPFKGVDPAFEDIYAQWVKTYPKSYAAHQARGFYYLQLVSKQIEVAQKKGTVTAEDEAKIQLYTEMAIKTNTAALTFAKKPILAYAYLIELYALSGSLVESRKMFEAANKTVPKNIEARFRYMKALEKIGRNLPEMHKIVENARQHGVGRSETSKTNAIFYGALLKQSQFALLDKELAEVQKSYEAGKIDDISLQESFSFSGGEADPALEEKYNAWVKAYPQSYAARQARAMYLYRVGFHARGYKYARETSAQEMAGLRLYMQRAFEDCNAAVAMTQKPLLSYNTLILIAKVNGVSLEVKKQLLEKANSMDPKNYIVRYSYMDSVQTRWGGSLDEMARIAEQVKSSGIAENLHWNYESLLLREKQWLVGQILEGRRDIGQVRTGL